MPREFIQIDVTGSDEVRAQLREALQRLQHPRDLMQAMGDRISANIERRFDTKADPSGAPWKPLAASTLAAYNRADTQKKGRNAGQVVRRGTLLERTGQMRASLAVAATDTDVLIGMSRETPGGNWQVPLLHEFGTRRMPRRGIFFADPNSGALGRDDQADLQEELREFLDDIFGR